jgi:hypothetical protein
MKKGNKSEAINLRQNKDGTLGNSKEKEPLISYSYVRNLIEATIGFVLIRLKSLTLTFSLYK